MLNECVRWVVLVISLNTAVVLFSVLFWNMVVAVPVLLKRVGLAPLNIVWRALIALTAVSSSLLKGLDLLETFSANDGLKSVLVAEANEYVDFWLKKIKSLLYSLSILTLLSEVHRVC